MSSHVIVFNVNIFTHHHCLQCLHTFLGVISGRKTESMRDFPVLSCNSHKHISPSTRFVVNTPKPTRGGTRCTYMLGSPYGRAGIALRPVAARGRSREQGAGEMRALAGGVLLLDRQGGGWREEGARGRRWESWVEQVGSWPRGWGRAWGCVHRGVVG